MLLLLLATRLCLETRADSEPAAFARLVQNELAHHPTHALVQEGCESKLLVELFSVAGVRYLTARVGQEVPVRFAIKSPRDLEDKLSDAIAQVLQHDPVYLTEDITRLNAVARTAASVVRHGVNVYRLEIFEVAGQGGRNAVTASGGAFAVVRGAEHAHVFARLEGAGSPRGIKDGDVVLRLLVGGDVGFAWEASPRENVSFYIGPGLGLHFLQFDGQGAPPIGSMLVSVLVRSGVRFLRFTNYDVDVFVQGHLPIGKTSDPDSMLVDAWTPYAQLGVGVGF
jgi:hypothetical protein